MAQAAGGLSIHCVDVAAGRVAAGLRVRVSRLDGTLVAEGLIGASGLLDHPALAGDAIGAGGYEVLFGVGDYFRAQGAAVASPAFLEEVPYRFHIADPAQHHHLPFKFTAWGYSLFRGA